jgi:hypothetical protein
MVVMEKDRYSSPCLFLLGLCSLGLVQSYPALCTEDLLCTGHRCRNPLGTLKVETLQWEDHHFQPPRALSRIPY